MGSRGRGHPLPSGPTFLILIRVDNLQMNFIIPTRGLSRNRGGGGAEGALAPPQIINGNNNFTLPFLWWVTFFSLFREQSGTLQTVGTKKSTTITNAEQNNRIWCSHWYISVWLDSGNYEGTRKDIPQKDLCFFIVAAWEGVQRVWCCHSVTIAFGYLQLVPYCTNEICASSYSRNQADILGVQVSLRCVLVGRSPTFASAYTWR